VAYGNGPIDQSVSASTVFDKETSLTAGYVYNESSGNLLDVTSNNNDGNVVGATQDQNGFVGKAYSFDGIDDYVDTGISGFEDENVSVFISITNSVLSENNTLFGFYDQQTTLNHFYIWIKAAYSQTAVGVGDNFVNYDELNDETEYNVVLVVDGTTAKYYVNGSEVGSFSFN
jgi:hypothetical protein